MVGAALFGSYAFARMASHSAVRVLPDAQTPAKPEAPSCRAVRSSEASFDDLISTSFQRSGLGSRAGDLPHQPSSAVEGSEEWESVEPIIPNLNGFTPSSCSSFKPLRNAARAYSYGNISGVVGLNPPRLELSTMLKSANSSSGDSSGWGLTGAFGLRHLHERLKTLAHPRIVRIDRHPAFLMPRKKHRAAGQVAVVGNR